MPLSNKKLYTIRFTYPEGFIKECKRATVFLMRYPQQGLSRKHPTTKRRPIKIQVYPKLTEQEYAYLDDIFKWEFHPAYKGVFENLDKAPAEVPDLIQEGNKMSNDIEKMIQDKNLNAPRLTPQHIEDTIVEENYSYPLGTLTICVLVLVNGFKVLGQSDCVSPENYDKEVGNKVAKDDAMGKIWQLEGYLLKQKLFEKGE